MLFGRGCEEGSVILQPTASLAGTLRQSEEARRVEGITWVERLTRGRDEMADDE